MVCVCVGMSVCLAVYLMTYLWIMDEVSQTVLQVNNDSLVDADHYFAVDVLKNSGNNITMVVAREKLLPNSHSPVSFSSSFPPHAFRNE